MKFKKIADAFRVAFFLAVLFFPMAANRFSVGEQTAEMVYLMENRQIATLSDISIRTLRYRDMKRLPKRIEAYCVDLFPFRLSIVSALAQAQKDLFSRANERGVFGKDGWLFYNAPDNRTVDDYLGMLPLSREQFARHFDIANEKRRFFESLGIKYYLLIAPDKATIHPEFLPVMVREAKGVSRRERYMDYYRERIAEGGIPDFIIDPSPWLIEAKERLGPMYFPRDTHWNWSGRLVAAKVLCDRIRRDFPALETIPEVTVHDGIWRSDLVPILEGKPLPKDICRAASPDANQWDGIEFTIDGEKMETMRLSGDACLYRNGRDAVAKLNALLVGDSFWAAFHPAPEALVFRSLLFQRYAPDTLTTRRGYSNMIAGEKPDVIIEENVERYFFTRDRWN